MSKYFTEEDFERAIGFADCADVKLMTADSYDENKIAETIKSMDKNDQKILAAVAINIAVVGFGNKNFGHVTIGKDVVDIKKTLLRLKVNCSAKINEKLQDGELTPSRLCRFYRFLITRFLTANKDQSYIFRKYSTRDPRFRHVLYRGSEFLDLQKEEANYLHRLKEEVPLKRLMDLGIQFDDYKLNIAPTRPHPDAPDKGLVGTVVNALTKPIDELRDKMDNRNVTHM